VIEHENTHASKKPWRGRLHHGGITIQAWDHKHAIARRFGSIGCARRHATLYSIASPATETHQGDPIRSVQRALCVRRESRMGVRYCQAPTLIECILPI
jgi:hypothetical protein